MKWLKDGRWRWVLLVPIVIAAILAVACGGGRAGEPTPTQEASTRDALTQSGDPALLDIAEAGLQVNTPQGALALDECVKGAEVSGSEFERPPDESYLFLTLSFLKDGEKIDLNWRFERQGDELVATKLPKCPFE